MPDQPRIAGRWRDVQTAGMMKPPFKEGGSGVPQAEAKGASKSLRRSINELEAILEGHGVQVTGALRADMYRLIRDYGEHWYRLGFARGIETIRALIPKVVDRLLPIRVRQKLWLLGRPSGIFRRVTLRHD